MTKHLHAELLEQDRFVDLFGALFPFVQPNRPAIFAHDHQFLHNIHISLHNNAQIVRWVTLI